MSIFLCLNCLIVVLLAGVLLPLLVRFQVRSILEVSAEEKFLFSTPAKGPQEKKRGISRNSVVNFLYTNAKSSSFFTALACQFSWAAQSIHIRVLSCCMICLMYQSLCGLTDATYGVPYEYGTTSSYRYVRLMVAGLVCLDTFRHIVIAYYLDVSYPSVALRLIASADKSATPLEDVLSLRVVSLFTSNPLKLALLPGMWFMALVLGILLLFATALGISSEGLDVFKLPADMAIFPQFEDNWTFFGTHSLFPTLLQLGSSFRDTAPEMAVQKLFHLMHKAMCIMPLSLLICAISILRLPSRNSPSVLSVTNGPSVVAIYQVAKHSRLFSRALLLKFGRPLLLIFPFLRFVRPESEFQEFRDLAYPKTGNFCPAFSKNPFEMFSQLRSVAIAAPIENLSIWAIYLSFLLPIFFCVVSAAAKAVFSKQSDLEYIIDLHARLLPGVTKPRIIK